MSKVWLPKQVSSPYSFDHLGCGNEISVDISSRCKDVSRYTSVLLILTPVLWYHHIFAWVPCMPLGKIIDTRCEIHTRLRVTTSSEIMLINRI